MRGVHVQAIMIVLPILVCAAIVGALTIYVMFVLLPRMRRAEKRGRPDAKP